MFLFECFYMYEYNRIKYKSPKYKYYENCAINTHSCSAS